MLRERGENSGKKTVPTGRVHLSVERERGIQGWAGLVRAAAGLLPGFGPRVRPMATFLSFFLF
jgi:hypothetical protein